MKILVIDDEAVVLESCRKVLSFTPKPFTPDELLSAVRGVIGKE